jgi:hypothetical protein
LRCSIRSLIWDISVLLIYALMAIKFSLRTAFAVSHRFWYVVFSFSLTSRTFLFLLLFLFWPTDYWAMCYSASSYLRNFCCCLCCWVLVLLHCDQIEYRGLFQFSYICGGLLWP